MAERKTRPAAKQPQQKKELARRSHPASGTEGKPQELTREQLEALRNRLQKKFH